jgi:hypothetical protein
MSYGIYAHKFRKAEGPKVPEHQYNNYTAKNCESLSQQKTDVYNNNKIICKNTRVGAKRPKA